MQNIVSTNTPKVITRISITPERLNEIIKSMQLAEGNALPGQEIDLEVAPGVVFTYDPKIPTFSAQADRARKPIVLVGSPAESALANDLLEHLPEGKVIHKDPVSAGLDS